MSAIGLASYAIHRNDFGHKCYVNVGTSYALVQDVLRDVKGKGKYDQRHDLVMHTVVVTGNEPIKKGAIQLTITKVETGPALSPSSTSHGRVGALQGNSEQVNSTLTQYIESTMALEQALPDTLPNCGRMRAYYDISETGAQMTPTTFLPVAAYARLETPRCNEAYFQNAFSVVLKRRGMTPSVWHDFDRKEKARTMAQMISYAVQTFDYIGDAVEMSSRMQRMTMQRHVGNEEFSDIFNSLTGDCEDGARGIYATYKGLMSVQFVDPVMREIQQIAGEYMPLMTLSVVHGAKIGDEEGFGAHMYLPLMPKTQFEQALQQTPQGKQLLERMAPATPLVNADMQRTAAVEGELPFLFCEGTGRIDPLGYRDPVLDQRKYIASKMPSVAGFKKEIPREEGAPSSFYYANLLGISGELMDHHGIPVGGFIFCSVNPETKTLTRGAMFTDMINNASHVAILPQPPLPQSVQTMIGEAVALRPPARPLEYTGGSTLPRRDPHWDRYVAAVKSYARSPPATRPATSIDLIVRPHQFSGALIQQMIAETAQLDRIYDASYAMEPVTDSIYHWRVQLWVK